jgi:ABC-2 type transport system ATP-binding protein
MAELVVEARDLTKHYGSSVGLEGLDLEVEGGEVLGFLGPNGAGKTTTIRLLLDLIRPTRGEARLFGQPASEHGVRARIGFLSGELTLDEHVNGRQLLEFVDRLRPAGAPPCDPKRRAELCERLRLSGADLERRIGDDSRGTKQKIGLVAAMQRNPELLVLDEPTTALDPLVREEFFALLREAGDSGRTVFHSSHVLNEVERTCTRVAILRAGKLVMVRGIDELRAAMTRKMVVHFAVDVTAEELVVPGTRVLSREGRNGREVVLEVSGELDPLLAVLARHSVQHMVFPEPDLEGSFRDLYGGAS